MGFGHWQGEIPLTKANAGRPAKAYVDRLLGDPDHHLHLREKLLPFGLLLGGGELIIREAKLLVANQPKSWPAITRPLSRE